MLHLNYITYLNKKREALVVQLIILLKNLQNIYFFLVSSVPFTLTMVYHTINKVKHEISKEISKHEVIKKIIYGSNTTVTFFSSYMYQCMEAWKKNQKLKFTVFLISSSAYGSIQSNPKLSFLQSQASSIINNDKYVYDKSSLP